VVITTVPPAKDRLPAGYGSEARSIRSKGPMVNFNAQNNRLNCPAAQALEATRVSHITHDLRLLVTDASAIQGLSHADHYSNGEYRFKWGE